jgi:hypothetical protein
MSPTNGEGSAGEVNSPGWKLLNSRWLWWDGEQYTLEWDGITYLPLSSVRGPRGPRPSASMEARMAMIGIAVLECVVLWWGAGNAEERQCESSEFTYTDVGGLWLPWLVLLLLALLGLAVSRRAAPGVRWIKVLAVLGLVATGVTFPGLVAFVGAANCGL